MQEHGLLPKVQRQAAGSGNPVIDAIRGNNVWEFEGGVPKAIPTKTCSDGGAEVFHQSSDQIFEEASISPPLGSAISYTGTRFETDPFHDDNRPSTIEESDSEDIVKRFEDSMESARRKLREMDTRLREQSCEPFEGPGFYIPINRLYEIVTLESITTILPCITQGAISGSFGQLAQDIFGRRGENQKSRTFRQILAILVLIGKANMIFDFMMAGITDSDLPLLTLGEKRPFQLCLARSGGDPPTPISLFETWEYRDIESFSDSQWQVLAPFLSRGTEEDDWVRHYKLSWRRPLPFEIIQDGCSTSGDAMVTASSGATASASQSSSLINGIKGGYGKVWKVRVHPAHHNLPSYRVRH